MKTYSKYFKFSVVFFLLIYPSVALSGEWIKDTIKKCDVWTDKVEPNESVTWSGECVNGKISGYGVLQWYKNGKKDTRYEGQCTDGKRTGKGTLIWVEGDKYVGDFVDGNFSGKGTYKSTDMVCGGEFRNGKLNGKGYKKWSNGNKYEGEFVNDIMNGKGTYTWPDGTKYIGDFANNDIEGKGVKIFPDGDKEEGIWKNGELIKAKTDDETTPPLTENEPAKEKVAKKEITKEMLDAVIKDLSKDMKKITDATNKAWSQETIVSIHGMILENGASGNTPKAAFLAQVLELLLSDVYYCAEGRNQQQTVTQQLNLYRNVKKEMIAATPDENRVSLMKLLDDQRKYYYKTKTRAVGFAKESCKKKVLSH